MTRKLVVLQRIQVCFHKSVVDAQELVSGHHHVGTVGLALRVFLVHELVDRLTHWSALQDDTHRQKESPAQRGRPPLGNAAATDIHLAGLVGRGVNTRKGHQCFLGMKTAHIANFGHELGTEGGPTPNIPITTGYSDREAARDCISCLRAANAAEVARSWEMACSTFYEFFH